MIGYAILAHYTQLESGREAARRGACHSAAARAWGRTRLAITLSAHVACIRGPRCNSHRDLLAGPQSNFPLVYLLEDVGFYALLSLTFARSLVSGRMPLCTHWADLVHGPLPPLVARYTRKTTAAWAVFFALIAAASLALYSGRAAAHLVGVLLLCDVSARRADVHRRICRATPCAAAAAPQRTMG